MGKRAAREPREQEIARWVGRLPSLLRARHVQAAFLFGSQARGEADALSDIDLMLVASSARPFVDRFRDYPELVQAPVHVDLVVYTPEEFARERRVNRFVRHVLRHARQIV